MESLTQKMKKAIDVFLNMELPKDWSKRDIKSRQSYIANYDRQTSNKDSVLRSRVCVKEICYELFDLRKEDKEYFYFARAIAAYIDTLEGWNKKTGVRIPLYGIQKGWRRKNIKRIHSVEIPPLPSRKTSNREHKSSREHKEELLIKCLPSAISLFIHYRGKSLLSHDECAKEVVMYAKALVEAISNLENTPDPQD
ncbi:MAG: hypothetical protein K2H47_08680 [Muribaculaceae bacterium]|nr:hypothetical protein [Muribaculaceae bacterium]